MSVPRGRKLKLLRLVAVASATGRYGGPFDTASRQVELAARGGFDPLLVAGSFKGDQPLNSRFLRTRRVWHILGASSFVDVYSPGLGLLVWRAIWHTDILHLSLAREVGPVLALALGRALKKPMVLQPHGMLTSRTSLLHKVIDQVVIKRLAGGKSIFLALSDREKYELEQWYPRLSGRVHSLGNPPPLGLEELRTEDVAVDNDALFAARLHPRKRVLDFGEAALYAAERGWEDSYEVLGPDEGELPQLLELAERVHNLSYRGSTDSRGVIERLRRSKVFVLASSNEPWGNVVVTALCLGKPVVITKSSVLAEPVGKFSAGAVVADSDPTAIAEAVHQILEPSVYGEYSRRASILAAQMFDELSATHGIARIYDLALAGEVVDHDD